MAPDGEVASHKKNSQKILRCDARRTVTGRSHSRPADSYPRPMNRETLRAPARCRRALLELHALPPGSLPEELEDLVEELVAPGYRERLLRAFLTNRSALPQGGGAVAAVRYGWSVGSCLPVCLPVVRGPLTANVRL